MWAGGVRSDVSQKNTCGGHMGGRHVGDASRPTACAGDSMPAVSDTWGRAIGNAGLCLQSQKLQLAGKALDGGEQAHWRHSVSSQAVVSCPICHHTCLHNERAMVLGGTSNCNRASSSVRDG
jgi:hypothetical protein